MNTYIKIEKIKIIKGMAMELLIDWDNKRWKEKENGDFVFNLSDITEKTFDTTAQKWSLVIANTNKGTEKNQLRNFYDKVIELYEKAQNTTKDEFKEKHLPFIKMLNSKVVYAKNKQQGKVNEAFVIFMNYALGQIEDFKSFENFKYLFEAIMGFYEKEYIKKVGYDRERRKEIVDCEKSIFFIKSHKDKVICREN